MGNSNHAIAFGNSHWKNVPMMSSVPHTDTGKEIQYKDLKKDPTLGPLFKKDLVMNVDAYSKESETYKEQILASF
jgi:hypothetical protein